MATGIKYLFNKDLVAKGSYSFLFAVLSVSIIPLDVTYLPPFLIAWAICRIFEVFGYRANRTPVNRSVMYLAIAFIVYYFWIIAGLIYSDDLPNGKLLIFRRLSLVMFPLVLLSPGEKIKKNTGFLLKIFTLATIAYLLVCYSNAFFRSISVQNGKFIFNPHEPEYEWTNYFLGDGLMLNQHPSYIGMYVLMSVFISFEAFSDGLLSKAKRYFWLASGIFLTGSVYFLSSRATYLAVLVLIPVYLIFKLGRKRLNLITVGILILILTGLSYIFFSNQRVQFFFDDPQNATIEQKVKMDFRIPIWNSAGKVISNNLLIGVGIGDACEKLKTEFKNLGYVNGFYDNLNAHNQFLEVLLVSGLIGLIVFSVILGMMLNNAIRFKSLLYGLFILMMIIYFMFESVLNRLAGVSFFSLFAFLLMNLENRNTGLQNPDAESK